MSRRLHVLDAFVSQFILGAGFPVLKVRCSYNRLRHQIDVSVAQQVMGGGVLLPADTSGESSSSHHTAAEEAGEKERLFRQLGLGAAASVPSASSSSNLGRSFLRRNSTASGAIERVAFHGIPLELQVCEYGGIVTHTLLVKPGGRKTTFQLDVRTPKKRKRRGATSEVSEGAREDGRWWKLVCLFVCLSSRRPR